MSRAKAPTTWPAFNDSDRAFRRGAVFDQSSSAACSVRAIWTAVTACVRSRLTTISVPSRPPSLRLASFIACSVRNGVVRYQALLGCPPSRAVCWWPPRGGINSATAFHVIDLRRHADAPARHPALCIGFEYQHARGLRHGHAQYPGTG